MQITYRQETIMENGFEKYLKEELDIENGTAGIFGKLKNEKKLVFLRNLMTTLKDLSFSLINMVLTTQ